MATVKTNLTARKVEKGMKRGGRKGSLLDIPHLINEYEQHVDRHVHKENIPEEGFGKWFPIPQRHYEDDIEELKQKEKDIIPAPNYFHFLYEFDRAYNTKNEFYDSNNNAIMIDLHTRRHSPMTIEKLHSYGIRLNFKARSYQQFRNLSSVDLNSIRKEAENAQNLKTSTTKSNHVSPSSPLNKHPFLFWVDILNPTILQMELLERAFGIHSLTTEDILTSSTREKQEEYPNYLFIVLKEVDEQIDHSRPFNPRNINIIIFPGFIISIHLDKFASFPKILYDLLYDESVEELSVDWILYKILDSNVKRIVSVVDCIQKDVFELDNSLFHTPRGRFMKNIGYTRQFMTKLRGELLSKREVLSFLLGENAPPFFRPNIKIFLRDVYDNVRLLVERIELSYEMLNNTNNTYLAMLSLEQAATNHKIGEVMKCFGAITTIVFPLTVISGLWGMNVEVPLQFDMENPPLNWFNFLVLAFACWIIVAIILFKYNRCM